MSNAAAGGRPLAAAAALLGKVNAAAAAVSAVATGVAGCVLTWEATARYLFKIPSDWQDELSVFLLVGATFLSAAWVQDGAATSASRRSARFCRPPPIACDVF